MTTHISKVAGTSFADVDGAADPSAYVSYLDNVVAQLPDYKHKSFQTLNLQEGMHVLDAGCGAGDDARAMAAIVGPAGRVVGLDSSATMVETAKTRTSAGNTSIEFVQGSLYELPFPDDSFDAARSDRVFQHLAEPERALRELMRVTKPGGRVNVIDPDFGAGAIDVDSPELYLRLQESSRRARLDKPGGSWMGRQLWGLFNSAGLREVQIQAEFLWTTSLAVADGISNLSGWGQDAYQRGDATLEEAEAWERELATRDREQRFFAGALLVSVVGVVP
jgi:SAM-dependent methyltransferase